MSHLNCKQSFLTSSLYYLRKCDFLGPVYTFENEDNQNFKTLVGGLSTIMVLISVAVLGFTFGNEVYERKIPVVSYSNEMLNNSTFYFNELPFMFSFVSSDADFSDQVVRKSLLNVNTLFFERGSGTSPNMLETYDLVICEIDRFTNLDEKQFKVVKEFIELNKYTNSILYCIPRNDTYYIQNKRGGTNDTWISIRFDQCDSSKDTCHENLESILQSLLLKTFYLNSFTDPKNFTDPIKYFMDVTIEKLSIGLDKEKHLSFSKNLVVSDNGWILEDISTQSYITLNKNYDAITLARNSLRLFRIYIDSPRFRMKIDRAYVKVQEVFATIGGLFNAFLLILQVLLYNYTRFKYINSIFKATYLKVLTSYFRTNKSEYLGHINKNSINTVFNKLGKTKTIKSNLKSQSNVSNPTGTNNFVYANEEFRQINDNKFSINAQSFAINNCSNLISEDNFKNNNNNNNNSKEVNNSFTLSNNMLGSKVNAEYNSKHYSSDHVMKSQIAKNLNLNSNPIQISKFANKDIKNSNISEDINNNHNQKNKNVELISNEFKPIEIDNAINRELFPINITNQQKDSLTAVNSIIQMSNIAKNSIINTPLNTKVIGRSDNNSNDCNNINMSNNISSLPLINNISNQLNMLNNKNYSYDSNIADNLNKENYFEMQNYSKNNELGINSQNATEKANIRNQFNIKIQSIPKLNKQVDDNQSKYMENYLISNFNYLNTYFRYLLNIICCCKQYSSKPYEFIYTEVYKSISFYSFIEKAFDNNYSLEIENLINKKNNKNLYLESNSNSNQYFTRKV